MGVEWNLSAGNDSDDGWSALTQRTALRPRPGVPDPKVMVLTSRDLGRARVTAQHYFKDPDFPSVISYEREFEYGKAGSTPLPYVDSQAEVGSNAVTTTGFLRSTRAYFGSKEARRLIAESFTEDIGSDSLVSNLQVGRPRSLGVGPASFDVLVTASVLGLRTDFHFAVFRVERILGLVSAIGEPGSPVQLSVMTRPVNIDAARGLGFWVIQFTDAAALRLELVGLGLLSDARAAAPSS